jgi:hypothetical protein
MHDGEDDEMATTMVRDSNTKSEYNFHWSIGKLYVWPGVCLSGELDI